MKKIMFNDKYGLTQAVLDGRKTQTRRIVPQSVIDKYEEWRSDVECIAIPRGSTIESLKDWLLRKKTSYMLGEIVAVAQSYHTLGYAPNALDRSPKDYRVVRGTLGQSKGWRNKMFVRAEACKHYVRITGVRVERLQDISDEDCLREGITDMGTGGSLRYSYIEYVKQTTGDLIAFSNNFVAVKEAYASLIDKVSGKGTWERNPYVWVYEFELVD